jgi:NAD(P)-dependent dehydrogenase (short-subunit alcohol dehydrogenase family)
MSPLDPRIDRALIAGARAAGVLVNPPGRVSDEALRASVAGKVVLVTGASYGLGEATARRLAAAGAEVLLVARTAERLDELAAEIAHAGGTAHPYAADLTDPASVDALAASVLARHAHVDVLINNAGKSIRRSIELSLDRPQDFQRTIDINYTGPVRLMLALLPAMRARRQGHVINVSTIGVRLPPAPRWSAYQASKGAFDTFFRSAGIELRKDGIATTSVYMALMFTRMSAPTPSLRYAPGQTPEEAASVIARAIVKRPRAITPWWAHAAEITGSISRAPWELITERLYRASSDTAASTAAAGVDEPTAAAEPTATKGT